MIKFRDLPGVQGIEDALLINSRARVKADWDLVRRIDEVSVGVFAISREETRFEWPLWIGERTYDELSTQQQRRLDALWDDWHCHFEFVSETSGTRSEWNALGWDVSGLNGAEMESLQYFDRQMICASKGLRGRPLSEIATDLWGRALAAKPFVNDDQKVMNQQFLSLGRRTTRPSRITR